MLNPRHSLCSLSLTLRLGAAAAKAKPCRILIILQCLSRLEIFRVNIVHAGGSGNCGEALNSANCHFRRATFGTREVCLRSSTWPSMRCIRERLGVAAEEHLTRRKEITTGPRQSAGSGFNDVGKCDNLDGR